MSLRTYMLRFHRLMAAMETDITRELRESSPHSRAARLVHAFDRYVAGVSVHTSMDSDATVTLTVVRRAPWYQCLTRGFTWEREWVGVIK
jgi:hypothetical protein